MEVIILKNSPKSDFPRSYPNFLPQFLPDFPKISVNFQNSITFETHIVEVWMTTHVKAM